MSCTNFRRGKRVRRAEARDAALAAMLATGLAKRFARRAIFGGRR